MTSQFSLKNTGVRRIMEEVNEMKKDPSDQYHAMPLEDNIFDWHFTLRGPKGTDFEGGFYHGRIVLPSGYPFKPPNIYFLNENGRFEIRKKICLSFSAYHPEEWQPAWGIRTILEALISFMPSKSEGAIGGLNWTKEERQKCIKKSLSYSCPHCGPIKDLIPEECIVVNEDGKEKASKNKYADAIAQMHFHAPGSNNNNNDKKKPSTTKSPSKANVSKKKPASKPKAAVVSNNTESKMNDSNLKIIQVSDLHFLKDGETMYGANPVIRFRAFVNDVNKNHRNADLVVITGDIAHNGIKESYQLFKEELKKLDLPSVIMIGNHDNPGITVLTLR